MLGQFFEQRIATAIWPEIEHLYIAIPEDHPAMALPVPLQATTATANLALAASIVFEMLPDAREIAQLAVTKIEHIVFERIDADRQYYPVGQVLKLEKERAAWVRYVEDPSMDMQSNLKTIHRVVHGTRIESYQSGFRKGMIEWVSKGAPAGGYGPMGYFGKQWLSEISGRAILQPDNLLEDGFPEMGLTCYYFANIWTCLNSLITN